MNRLATLTILAVLSACKSSAPYTVPAVAINGTLAAGAALRQRAAGGCYAVCAHGTVCNPRTGYCEPSPCANCQSWEVCVETEIAWRCVPGAATGMPAVAQKALPTAGSAGGLVPGVGISPETGSVPSLPPRKPAE